jgi:hypothetical protein
MTAEPAAGGVDVGADGGQGVLDVLEIGKAQETVLGQICCLRWRMSWACLW